MAFWFDVATHLKAARKRGSDKAAVQAAIEAVSVAWAANDRRTPKS